MPAELASTLRNETLFFLRVLALAVFTAIIGADFAAADVSTITEVSGIARSGNKLLLVSDDDKGCFYELALGAADTLVIPIDPLKLKRISLPSCEAISDLEGIDVLADGRVAVLSEDLEALYVLQPDGFFCASLVQFSATVTEFGNRGVEGFSVLKLPNGKSRIAVTWEGGYPVQSMLPVQLGDAVSQKPHEPILIIADLQPGQRDVWLNDSSAYRVIVTPKEKSASPYAQRFRSPDLVWHNWSSESSADTGIIAILSSENHPPRDSGVKPEYKEKLLLRYTLDGIPYGEPLDINAAVKPIVERITATEMASWSDEMIAHFYEIKELLAVHEWENVNWEGICWFQPGQSLALVYDGVPADPPFAVIIPIPESWK